MSDRCPCGFTLDACVDCTHPVGPRKPEAPVTPKCPKNHGDTSPLTDGCCCGGDNGVHLPACPAPLSPEERTPVSPATQLDFEEAQERIRVLDYRLNRPHSEFVDKEGAKALLEDAKFLSAEVQRLRGERDREANTCRECGDGRPGWTVQPRLPDGEAEQVQCRTCDERYTSAESSLASLRASHEAVMTVVREWQEARKAWQEEEARPEPWNRQKARCAALNRLEVASDALSAFPLEDTR